MVIGLSGKDQLVPSKAVKKYVELTCETSGKSRGTVDMLWWDGQVHGYCLRGQAVNEVVEAIECQEMRLSLRKGKQCKLDEGYDCNDASSDTSCSSGSPPSPTGEPLDLSSYPSLLDLDPPRLTACNRETEVLW